MRTSSILAMALLAGGAIGGGALQAVRAQATPPAYSIVEVEVLDAEGFQAFAKRNAVGVAAAGGHFIVRRGRVVTSEGTPPKGVFVIAWDSLDKASGYFEFANLQGAHAAPRQDREGAPVSRRRTSEVATPRARAVAAGRSTRG